MPARVSQDSAGNGCAGPSPRRAAPAPVPPVLPPHAAAPARWALAWLRAPARLQARLAARGGCWPRADTWTRRHTDTWPHGSERSRTGSEGARRPPPRSGGGTAQIPQSAVPFTFLFYPALPQEHCHLWLGHPTHHLRIHVAVSALKGKSPTVSHLLREEGTDLPAFLPGFHAEAAAPRPAGPQLRPLPRSPSSHSARAALAPDTSPSARAPRPVLRAAAGTRQRLAERANAQQLQQRLVPSKHLYLILQHSESVQLYEEAATQR